MKWITRTILTASRVAIAISLIAALFMASTGLTPVVIPAEVMADTEWYPCIGHHCGCKDAASCRAHCCCTQHPPETVVTVAKKSCCAKTGEELLADINDQSSAKAHGDTPTAPAFRLELRTPTCAGSSHALLTGKGESWIPTAPPTMVASLQTLATMDCTEVKADAVPRLRPPVPPPRA